MLPKKKGVIIVANISMELILLLQQLPEETKEKIVFVIGVVLITLSIEALFVVGYICRK